MNINFHIERLVLDGVNITVDQSHLMQANVTSELTRMFTESFTQGAALRHMSTEGIQLTGNNPTQIAQSVYGGIAHG